MKTVAIIAEYNPFHNGHQYQINKIRENFGSDTAIIAIMSGNFTERGEPAFMDKWERARAACECGVNLVLELPFPYSMSSAEFFGRAGVHIINSLGCVDAISFGSECGDIDLLISTAKNMQTEEYKSELSRFLNDKKNDSLGYAKICEKVYQSVYGISPPASSSNNILALEYIKAALEFNFDVNFHTVKRIGAEYNSTSVDQTPFQSASAIRCEATQSLDSLKEFMPSASYEILKEQFITNNAPVSEEKISLSILSSLRLNSPDTECKIHDTEGGLYNRLVRLSHEADSLSALKKLASTKKYTDARIRRAIWFSYLGVTSSDVRTLPEYTQILAMDKVGQAILKKVRKTSRISVITRPSTTPGSDLGAMQKARSDRADSIFLLAMPSPMPSSSIYKKSPFVKVD